MRATVRRTLTPSICEGESVTVGGHTYSIAGTYRDTLTAANGCDSIITTTLTVKPTVRRTTNPVICQGASVTVGGHLYTIAGTYLDTLQAASGCDSIITTRLTVNPVWRITSNRGICQGQSITVGVHTYSASGTYIDTLVSSRNCDSIITTNLTVSEFIRTTINPSICEGEGITVGTSVYSVPGTYKDTLSSSSGCDSIVTTNLSVNPTVRTSIAPDICEGQVVTVGNHVYSVSGVYSDTLISNTGCDSIITTNLTVKPTKRISLAPFICEGQSITVGTNVYSITGTYKDTLVSASGCDSIITTDLKVNPAVVDMAEVICEGDSIVVGDEAFDLPGDYSVLLTSSLGCDSTVNLSLDVASAKSTELSYSICEGENITVGNQSFNESGQFTVSLTSAEGCDSTVYLALTVNEPQQIEASAEPVIAEAGEDIQLLVTPDANGNIYNWTPDGLVSDPAIADPVATITQDTWFYITVTDENGCESIDSVLIQLKGPEGCESLNIFIPSAFTPNGDGQNDRFRVRSSIPIEKMTLTIFNRWGESIFESTEQELGWDGTVNGQKASADSYVFSFKGTCGGNIITRQGGFVLIR